MHLISETFRCKNGYIYILELRKHTIVFCYKVSILQVATGLYKLVSTHAKLLQIVAHPELDLTGIVTSYSCQHASPYQFFFSTV